MGLRLRIFLFFVLLGLGSVAATGVGAWLSAARSGAAEVVPALIQAGLVAGVLILLLTTWIWLLFDTHVARAIESLASAMRARAHAPVDDELDHAVAKYLGDLAPAAAEVTRHLSGTRNTLAQSVARETARLSVEKTRMEALLAAVPVAVLVCTGEHRLVFYNGEAVDLLDAGQSLGLDRSLLDCLQGDDITDAYGQLLAAGAPDEMLDIPCAAVRSRTRLAARMRLLSRSEWPGPADAPAYVLTLHEATGDPALHAGRERMSEALPAPPVRRTATYDFDLLSKARGDALAEIDLHHMTYVVFDTETTGLAPSVDAIVQIAAVRVINGRRVDGEAFETLVNPRRRIPPGSTAIHGITDAMVSDAPVLAEVAARFHRFADGAVLVAHNAPFDMEFLRRAEEATGVRFDHPVLDTVLLSAVVFGQSEDHSLDALCRRLGVVIPADARHTAMGDTTATAEAFLRLLPMLGSRGLGTFGAVLAETRRHARLLRDLN